MRYTMVLLHRWLGLAIAGFLFVAGLTGAVISWDHELDELLNPRMYRAATQGRPQPSLQLAARLEAQDPRARATYVPLGVEPGRALSLFVEPRIDVATGKPFDLDYNQVALDPVTGAVQQRRYWGAVSLSRENLLPFLYKLHYSMHIPDGFGIEIGVLVMGVVGLVWIVDCFIALGLSFPRLDAWRKSFAFRGGRALSFYAHRSGGVWVWLLLLILAVTSVSMNLNTQLMRPLVSLFSPLTPSPFDAPVHDPAAGETTTVTPQSVLASARSEAAARGWAAPAGAWFHSIEYGVYGVGFFEPDNSHGDGGLGNPWLYFDASTGQPAGAEVPGEGSAGDIFMQAQFPLHSGRILGVTGRVLMSFMGLVVAGLSLTGILIWIRKRRIRVRVRRIERAATSEWQAARKRG